MKKVKKTPSLFHLLEHEKGAYQGLLPSTRPYFMLRLLLSHTSNATSHRRNATSHQQHHATISGIAAT